MSLKRARRPQSGRTNLSEHDSSTTSPASTPLISSRPSTAKEPLRPLVISSETAKLGKSQLHATFAENRASRPSTAPTTTSSGTISDPSSPNEEAALLVPKPPPLRLPSRPNTSGSFGSARRVIADRASLSARVMRDEKDVENESGTMTERLPPRPNTSGSARGMANRGSLSARVTSSEKTGERESDLAEAERFLSVFREKVPQKFKSPRKAFIAMSTGGRVATKTQFERVAKTIGVTAEEEKYDEMFNTVSHRNPNMGYHTFLKELWPDDRIGNTEPSVPQLPVKFLFLQDRFATGPSQTARIRHVFNENVPVHDGNDGNYSSVSYNILHLRDEHRPKRPFGVGPPSSGYPAHRHSRSYPGLDHPFSSEAVRRALLDPTHTKTSELPVRVTSFVQWHIGKSRMDPLSTIV